MSNAFRSRLALFVCGLALFLPLRSTADDSSPAPTSLATTTAPVTDPASIADHYRQVAARPEFLDDDQIDLTTRFQDELAQWFRQFGARMENFKYGDRLPEVESLLITLMVIFCVWVVIYIMLKLTRRRARMDAQPEEQNAGRKTFRPAEAYDREIRDAARAGDWHAAWLASWRQFLSRLEDRQLVDVDRTRTNREYLRQLGERALPGSALNLLGNLVDAYDRFIYGRKSINESDWNTFVGQINEAGLLLHLDDDRVRAGNRTKSS